MTINERLRRWFYGGDGLDLEIEESIAGEYERTGGMTPESFAKLESQYEDKRHALVLEEETNYAKMHEWSETRGKKLLKTFYL